LKEIIKEKKIDEIKKKTEALNKLVQELSVELYQKAQQEQQGKQAGENKEGEEKVVEGEFEEEKKEK